MGKKKKRDKKNKIYTKKQFINIICTYCGICGYTSFNPTFCYEEMYKKNPSAFMEHCYVHLIKLKMESESRGFALTIVNQHELKEIFCCSDVCGRKAGAYCEHVLVCLKKFRDQMFGTGSARTRRNKKKEKFICAAYPTFFTNDNEEWKNEIKGILEDGN